MYTALMWAALKGNTEILDMLINAGADVNQESSDVWLWLWSFSIISLLLQYTHVILLQRGTTALKEALKRDHKECVELLLAAGANADSKDEVSKLLKRWNGECAWLILFYYFITGNKECC